MGNLIISWLLLTCTVWGRWWTPVIGELQFEILGFGRCPARWLWFAGRGWPHAWHVVSATSSSMMPPPYLNASTPVSFVTSVLFVSVFQFRFFLIPFLPDFPCLFVLWCGFVAVYVVFNLYVSTQLLLSIFLIWVSHNFTFPWSGSSLFCIYLERKKKKMKLD